jgi:hypothetical protein
MKRSIWRGAVVAAAVGALAVGLVPAASAADPIDVDTGSPSLNVPAQVDTWRIAGNSRIQTAIEAAQVRNDWGRVSTGAVLQCPSALIPGNGTPVDTTQFPVGTVVSVPVTVPGVQGTSFVDCTVVANPNALIDVIIARVDDYPDALASAPLADVMNAPILLNPTDSLDPDVADYLNSLSQNSLVVVHLLGGTNALSENVRNEILADTGADVVVRHQGVNRYQTAVGLADFTIFNQWLNYFIDGDTGIPTFGNVYLTTGTNFPDALSAGAAAANNSGVVLLTKGAEFDTNPSNFSFTFDYLANLPTTIFDIVGPNFPFNTPENFAVGGPAVTAADNADVRLADRYDGVNRYETAVLVDKGTFDEPFAGKNYFALASGTNYPDAVVAAGFIANLDGPLLLSDPTDLYRAFGNPTGNPYTAAYLQANANNQDLVFVFGGTGSLNQNVQGQVEDVLNF